MNITRIALILSLILVVALSVGYLVRKRQRKRGKAQSPPAPDRSMSTQGHGVIGLDLEDADGSAAKDDGWDYSIGYDGKKYSFIAKITRHTDTPDVAAAAVVDKPDDSPKHGTDTLPGSDIGAPPGCVACPLQGGYYTCDDTVLKRSDVEKGPSWSGANKWIENAGNQPMLREYPLPSQGESSENYFLKYRGKKFYSSSVGPDPLCSSS